MTLVSPSLLRELEQFGPVREQEPLSRRTSWRIGVDEEERTELVTRGIFALVRNPVFTGMGVLLAGQALVVPSAISVAALAVFVAAVQVQVRAIEEPYLVRTHGAAYRSYTTRTGRFVPLVGRQRPKDV